MNATTKHDFHPDAESLSAFAEQALGERERGQVLAHLARVRPMQAGGCAGARGWP